MSVDWPGVIVRIFTVPFHLNWYLIELFGCRTTHFNDAKLPVWITWINESSNCRIKSLNNFFVFATVNEIINGNGIGKAQLKSAPLCYVCVLYTRVHKYLVFEHFIVAIAHHHVISFATQKLIQFLLNACICCVSHFNDFSVIFKYKC